MCERFFKLNNEMKYSQNNKFNDVLSSHWAYNYINNASEMNWISGYADGSFKPDSRITRAEVVTIVNRVTGRYADVEYINKNMSSVNRFKDMKDKSYWGFYSVIEASREHTAAVADNDESWVK